MTTKTTTPKKKRSRPRSNAEKTRNAKHFARCTEAFKMQCEGATDDEIAAKLGWRSRQAVHDAMKKYMARVASPLVELVRLKHLEQIRMMTEVNLANASAGDSFAIANQIRLQEREARIIGSDTPTRHEVTGKDGEPLQPLSPVLNITIDADPNAIQRDQPSPAPEAGEGVSKPGN